MLRKQKLLQMINIHGRNHPGGHDHPLLSSTTPDRRIRTPVFLTKINNIIQAFCLSTSQVHRGPYALICGEDEYDFYDWT